MVLPWSADWVGAERGLGVRWGLFSPQSGSLLCVASPAVGLGVGLAALGHVSLCPGCADRNLPGMPIYTCLGQKQA